MATDSEALDIIESKIHELEKKVYGENFQPSDHFNPVVDSLLQADTIMTSAVSGMEKFTSLYKRLRELNNYLEINPVSDDPTEIITKLNVILSMKDEYRSSVELMEKVNELKDVFDDDGIRNVEALKTDLNRLIESHLSKRERLEEINNEIGQVLTNFNEVCLEISKSFFLLNEAITKLENSKKDQNEGIASSSVVDSGHFLNSDGTPQDVYHHLHLPHDPPLYPAYSKVPKTSFACDGREWGYYADTEAGCQVYHLCRGKKMESFLCPNATLFHDQFKVCDQFYNVRCGWDLDDL